MSRLGDWLAGHIGFPCVYHAKALWRRAAIWPMRQLRLFQRLARSEPKVWRSYRDQRLSALLEHVLQQIPFYEGLGGDLMDCVRRSPMEALRKLPVLTKRDLQEHEQELFAADVPRRRMHVNYSGGSTGEPTRFWQEHGRDVIRHLGAARDTMYTGWRPGRPVGLVWGAERDFFWKTSLVYRTQNAVAERFIGLNAFRMTEEALRRFLDDMERWRPSILLCYAGAVAEFAAFLEAEGLTGRARAVGLDGVVCSAEKLYPFQRLRIEEVFGCRAFDRYGSREMDVVAMECGAHDGLHVSADNVVVEILDEKNCPVPHGEEGRIVVTDLWNRGFALIRFDLGDLGRFMPAEEDPCPCGVTFPRLAAIEGRTSDLFILPDGSRMHGEYVTHLFYGVPGVREFQMVQETERRFTLSIVADGALVEPRLERILQELRERLQGAQINVRFCKELPRTQSGKRRFTISRIRDTA